MSDLKALRARVNAATGEDRKLDAALFAALVEPAVPKSAFREKNAFGAGPWHYTSSLDDAFYLAEFALPGAQIFPSNVGYARIIRVDGDFRGRRFDAENNTERRPTPALALLSALLAALDAEENT